MKKILSIFAVFAACVFVNEINAQAAVTVAKTVHDTAVVLRTNSKTYLSDSLTAYHARPDTGSFTITLTGVVNATTGTARYALSQYQVTLYIPVLVDTSNSTACTLTGMPAGIRPAQAQTVDFHSVEDAGAFYVGTGSIGTNGTITMKIKTAANTDYTATFTNSATVKGIPTVTTIVYQIQ
jgi:hypothetical protein